MIEFITAILVMAVAGITQSAILSKMPLLLGTADLVLLTLTAWTVQDRVRHPWIWGCAAGIFVTYSSQMPTGIFLLAYLIVAGLAYFARRRIWKAPMLTMIALTLIGNIVVAGLSIVGLSFMGVLIDFAVAFNLIVLPGLFLNMLLAVPVYVFVREITRWLYPGDASIPSDGGE